MLRRGVIVEQPTRVGVPETLDRLDHPLAVAGVRAVGIAALIGELMMFAVVRNPTDDIPLDGALTGDRECIAHPAVRLKRPVREQPVVADGDSYARDDIAHQQDHQLPGSNHAIPEQGDRNHETDQRLHGPSQIGQLAGPAHPVPQPMAGPSFGRGLDSHRATRYRPGPPAPVSRRAPPAGAIRGERR